VKVGTTTFSFTNEWLAGGLTFEQLLARVSDQGLGPGIEVIGFQTWRGFPHVPRRDVLAFRRSCDGLGLEPVALGGYVDLARRPDRLLSTSEAADFLRPQIDVAAALGFPILRLHSGIPFDVIEQVTRHAERADVTLATEIQGHQAPDDATIEGLLELRERLGSPNIALTLDFSVAMHGIPSTFVARVQRLGMDAADLEDLTARWHRGAPIRELFAALDGVDAPSSALVEARSGFVRFGRQRPEDWLPSVPYVAYAHAKFWEVDDAGRDPTVATAEMIAVLGNGGFEGFVCSEWGGSAWVEAEDVDAFEVVRRHRGLCAGLAEGMTRTPVQS
jgi:hypothetical protein